MGKAICILDPSYVKNRAPEDLHLGRGVESPQEIRHPVPPSEPPPYSTDRGGGGREKLLNVHKQFVNCLWGVFVGM